MIAGTIYEDRDAGDIYQMREEYKDYKFKNFKTNLANLRVLLNKNIERMTVDCIAYGKNRSLLIKLHSDNPPRFPTYPA